MTCDPPCVVRVPAPTSPSVVRYEVPGARGPVGPAGAQGPPGPTGPAGAPGPTATAPLVYPITASSSFAAVHGLPYSPEAWVVAPDGEALDTDIRHAPGVTTAIFPGPFTGILYLR